MKLPNGHSAIIEMVKLSDYVLSPVHPAGRHKARVFQSALGLTLTDAEELRDMLRDAAKEAEATLGNADEFGIRYIRDFERERSGRRNHSELLDPQDRRSVSAISYLLRSLRGKYGPIRPIVCSRSVTGFA